MVMETSAIIEDESSGVNPNPTLMMNILAIIITLLELEERWTKLEIPVFKGNDDYGWLNRVERFFELKDLKT